MTPAREIARLLADRIDQLAAALLPDGTREGRTWRCGSIAGDRGTSLSVQLAGPKRGLWHDFADDAMRGDALDLARCCLGRSLPETIAWAEHWLGIVPGDAPVPRRSASASSAVADRPPTWRRIWRDARPITGTFAQRYLVNRGLAFDDPYGDVLRFDPSRARLAPDSVADFEHHPALLALLRDVRNGELCGLHSIYLRPDGSDRLRDRKGKTSAGRLAGGAVMLSEYEDVIAGLTLTEGVETGIAVLLQGLAPCWAMCGASGVAAFPVLPGIECLTVASDRARPGEKAAFAVVDRWNRAGRSAAIARPLVDDWATKQPSLGRG